MEGYDGGGGGLGEVGEGGRREGRKELLFVLFSLRMEGSEGGLALVCLQLEWEYLGMINWLLIRVGIWLLRIFEKIGIGKWIW